jgi:hypothetical protein
MKREREEDENEMRNFRGKYQPRETYGSLKTKDSDDDEP